MSVAYKSVTNYISKRYCGFQAATIKGKQTLTLQQHADWMRNGYIIVRGLFDKEEMNILNETIKCDDILHKNEFSVNDSEGRGASLAIWDYLSNDTYGSFMASNRMYRIVSGLMNNAQIQHYHTKLMLKHAKTGGAFEWHQDYGYWYKNGLIFPDLITAFIAVDDCTKTNGCLEVLNGSHLLGRIEHLMIGGQTGADQERIPWIQEMCKNQFVELKAGDTLFFHCNLLHRSAPNQSTNSRYALLAAYNKATNKPFKQHHHICTDINIIDDDQIKKMGVVPTFDENIFMDPQKDKTAIVNDKEQ